MCDREEEIKSNGPPTVPLFPDKVKSCGSAGGVRTLPTIIILTIQVINVLFTVVLIDLFARCTFDSSALVCSCSGSFSVFCARTAQSYQ